LDAASLVLHVSEQLWPTDTLIMPPYVRDGLIHSFSGELALQEIGALLADPKAYQREQALQSVAYLQRCRDASDTFFD
jgi:hypothetical protein